MKPWSAEQKSAIPDLRLATTTKGAKAYHPPSKASAGGNRAANGAAFGAGLATGIVGGAVGGLVIGGTIVADQKIFESSNKDVITRIGSGMDHGIERHFDERARKELREIPFFSARLKNGSQNTLQSNVASYGLHRTGSGKPFRFVASVTTTTDLTGTGDERLLKSSRHTGTSGTEATLEEFAASPALLNRAFQEAAGSAAFQLALQLRDKTG